MIFVPFLFCPHPSLGPRSLARTPLTRISHGGGSQTELTKSAQHVAAPGKTYDMREKHTHGGTRSGWRISGSNMVWLASTSTLL